MKLYLPEGHGHLRGWNWTLCRMLVESKMFEVVETSFPLALARGVRNANWSMLRVGDALLGLDTWDSFGPTAGYLEAGLFDAGGDLAGLQALIKIQYFPCPFWEMFVERTGIRVRPWTVMPSHVFPLEAFSWTAGPHKYVATCTGKNNRFRRQGWVDWCLEHEGFYAKPDYVGRDSLEEYLDVLKECRWGLILKGKQRAHDGKNRRECEFASCGMPLALTYEPTYDFPMQPGEHYVRLQEPEDLERLRDIDPAPFAAAARELYHDHFSPTGMARTLIELVNSL